MLAVMLARIASPCIAYILLKDRERFGIMLRANNAEPLSIHTVWTARRIRTLVKCHIMSDWQSHVRVVRPQVFRFLFCCRLPTDGAGEDTVVIVVTSLA